MKTPNFPKVNQKQSFPALEEEIMKFWKENNVFEETITSREGCEEFAFYDGPPFATGTPHYGHILAGTIKDVITRYQTTIGKQVYRTNGWDCHGLPIENIVEKKLNISGREDIEKIGIHAFNEACRENVFGYVDDWKNTIERMGRFIDMDNSWKTMDVSFMQSVWSVFKNIYDKGLIYEGHRVVPYCPRCTTPLSNFEVNQGYKDKQSKAVTVKYKIKNDNFEINYRESCGIIILNENGDVLLGKKKSNGLLTFPGGKIEAGETPNEGIIRELEEETGIKINDFEIFSFNYSFNNGQDWKEHIYITNVKNDITFSNPESHKFESWQFYDKDFINNLNKDELESHSYQVVQQLIGNKETNKSHSTGNKYLLVWTTTPWSLVSNVGIAVGEDIDYVELFDNKTKDTYILARARVGDYYKNEDEYGILREYKGKCLKGLKYEYIYDDFVLQLEMGADLGTGIEFGKNVFSVVFGHHVTTESGTGIVHMAPAYGEDDNIIAKENDLGFVYHIDDSGKTYNLLQNNGMSVFDYNEKVILELKEKGVLFKLGTINHSYPHCWRCQTPLIYRAISAWYVAVEQIKDRMLKNNDKISWTPEIIKHGRFGKWLEGAKDWNISRNRYWGSAIPVWQSEDKKEEVCIGSIEELYQLNKDFGDITKVIFVRHGRTDYNDKGLMDYKGNANLTEFGKEQAENLKEKLKYLQIDAIFSSPLSRCQDTISPLALEKGLKINIVDDFVEINSPDLQDKEFNCKNYKWENGYGGGEKISEAYDRVTKSFKKIIEENKGKTIVICSHGDPVFLMRQFMTGVDYDTQKYTSGLYLENNPKYGIEKMFAVDYVYSKTCKQIDIHKHFVDEIFVKNENNFKAKKVFGIHGWPSKSDKTKSPSKWYFIRKELEKDGIIFDLPKFDSSENTTYKIWKEELEKYDVKSYDTIIGASFGATVILQYLKESKIHIKRLILQSPSGLIGNEYLETIINEFNYNVSEIKNYCDELIVICSKDDNDGKSTSFEYSKNFAIESGASFIEVDGLGHKFDGIGGNLLAGLVKYGTPLKRIPEVLDCWFESGAMPYASKGLVFESEKKEEKTTKVIFIRHAESLTNVEKIVDSSNKNKYPLTEKGLEQAKNLLEKLKNEKIDIIYSSPFERALQTIKLLAEERGIQIITDERLKETNHGKFYGITKSEEHKNNVDNFFEDENFVLGETGESKKMVFERMNSFLQEKVKENPGKNIIIVSHCYPITFLVSELTNNKNLSVKNAEPIEIVFESDKTFSESFKFPADFIAEGLDQTRGWFYTLLILGTALFDNTPFLNVIVNGIVLAEDGKKMSKSLKNYPDPKHIFDKYGADAMRFYLMNSPVVEAQDLRFSEAGVEEIVKKVILPLWNTYSFFTTYANIDNFEPKKGNLYFVRHAESESNAKWASIGGSVSGGNDNPKLTSKGIEQAIKAGKKLKLNGVNIDKIYTSDLERTIHTAELISKEIGFNGEIISLKELREQNYSDFEGKTHSELSKTYGVDVHDHVALRKIFKNSKVEHYTKFDERINSELEKILKENPNKNILIVGHAGSSRPIFRKYLNLEMDYAHLEAPTLKNSQVVKLPAYPLTNNLDKWIISELYTLIKNVSIGLDSYKINEATKYIVSFMDNLTNWYIRRSRKRFWKSENDNDKIEAYNTLYEVLVELSKVISPFMPFVSENIYKSLTGNKSVHLDVFPENIPSFIQEELNKDMDKTQKIINLGLAWRANHKIRVRQPLKSITIGEKLSDYYEEIIKEELNVKEIISVDGDKIAKKICKPNGRNIGPKFGLDVKFIMNEAKAGNFEELSNGDVKVGEFVLENGDFELVYEAGDSKYDIEAGFGMVIAMDSEITEELKLEGYSRDIVRQIQEARKEANYNVDDRIKVALIGDEISENIIKVFGNYIETETLSKIENNLENPDLEKDFEFEDLKVKIVLKR